MDQTNQKLAEIIFFLLSSGPKTKYELQDEIKNITGKYYDASTIGSRLRDARAEHKDTHIIRKQKAPGRRGVWRYIKEERNLFNLEGGKQCAMK